MNNDFPLVSIIIPVYNGSNYLRDAIDSALSQTYPNIEILVINDGSTDGGLTEDVAVSYGEKIKYIKKENGGVSSALNVGIKEMKGEYFSWLSHDDMYTENKVAAQVENLKSGADISVCSERLIDSAGNYMGDSVDYSDKIKAGVIDWQDELISIINDRLFSGCALLISKAVFESCGTFDETLRYNQDFDMWIRFCLMKHSWVYCNEIGVLSRIHDKQVTQTRRDLFYSDSYKLGCELIPKLSQISSKDHCFLYHYARHCAKYNLKKNVALCIKANKEKRIMGAGKILVIRITFLYGKIRPFLRRVYYRVFRKTKTV